LKRDAASGRAGAPFTLAILYLSGRLGDDKRAEAVPLLRASAEQKHNGALFVLGSLHGYGTLVPRDLPLAVSSYRLAAERGDPNAQNALGQLLRRGEGVSSPRSGIQSMPPDHIATLRDPAAPVGVVLPMIFCHPEMNAERP
jgi:TPR repeat protein